jgi:hypothetical protein
MDGDRWFRLDGRCDSPIAKGALMNVLDKYSELLTLVHKFMAARRRANRRAINPFFAMQQVGKMKDIRRGIEQPYALRTEGQQQLIAGLFKGQDMTDPAVASAMQRAPLLALAEYYRQYVQPTESELVQIKVLHNQESKDLRQLAPHAYVVGVLTIGTFVAKLVPKEVFEYLGWQTYGLYQTIVTIATLIVAIYVVLGLMPIWLMYRRPRPRRAATELCDAVLSYL